MAILYPRGTATLRRWLEQFWKPGAAVPTIELLQALTCHIFKTFKYQRRDEMGVQTPVETLAKNSGSCRDFATLMLEACRCWGLAARFVSGYMQCDATEAGGASTHAWTEVYLPGAGWKGFDPTSGIMTGAQYVPVAVSRNPENAAPIAGSFRGAPDVFDKITVDVTVVEVGQPPRALPALPQLPPQTSTHNPDRPVQQPRAPSPAFAANDTGPLAAVPLR
jgi:transglutaminase-like putative cysteine protease